MFAIEFQTKIKNGNIEIPIEYKDKFAGPVRVIVMGQDRIPQTDLIERLLANPIKLETFVPLTREEVYEQR